MDGIMTKNSGCLLIFDDNDDDDHDDDDSICKLST